MAWERLGIGELLCGIFVMLSPVWHNVGAEVFSSVADIEALIGAELQILDVLKELRAQKEQQIKAVDRYIERFGNIRKQRTLTELQQMATNPVGAFHLIHHMVKHFAELQEELDYRIVNGTMLKLDALRSAQNFPGKEDIPGMAEAFFRLQQTYKIHPEDFVSGTIPGFGAHNLTAAHCSMIGINQAKIGHGRKEREFLDSAIEWLTLAKKLYYEEMERSPYSKEDSVMLISEIMDWTQFSLYNSGKNLLRVIKKSEELLQINPEYPTTKDNLKFYLKLLHELNPDQRKELDVELQQQPKPYRYTRNTYSAVCRGERKVARRVRPFLKCRLETYGNPYLLLQPVKLEVAHVDPVVYLLHNAITHRQMEAVKILGMKHIARAKVINPNNDEGDVSESRVSKTAFLEEKLDSILPSINHYSGAIVNLSKENAEELQINNYGIGGHYQPHYDFFRDPDHHGFHLIKEQEGDRIATLMYYLSDVEAGGATVFPRLNLTVYPEKGSAVFWWDLYRDGKGDVRTLHGGCPVLSGTKWVANKWFRECGQHTHRPCALTKDSPSEEEEAAILSSD